MSWPDYLCATGLVLRARDTRKPVTSVAPTAPRVYVRSHTYAPHFRPGTTLAISGHDASLDPDKVCDPPPAKLAAAREPGEKFATGETKRRGAPFGQGERYSKIPFDPSPQPPLNFRRDRACE